MSSAKKPKAKKAKPDLRHIHPALHRCEIISIAELKLNPKNERKHPRSNIDTIKASLRTFAQREAIGVRVDGKLVIRGNGTTMALRELAEEKETGLWEGAPEGPLDWLHAAVTLYDDPEKVAGAYGLTHNRAGDLSTWDWEALSVSLEDLGDEVPLTDLGWEQAELDLLTQADWTPPEVAEPEGPATDIQAGQTAAVLMLKLEGDQASRMRNLAERAGIKPIDVLAKWISESA